MPSLPVLAAFCGGILLGHACPYLYVGAIPTALALFFMIFRRPWLFGLSAVAVAGFADSYINIPQEFPEALTKSSVSYSGVVESQRDSGLGSTIVLKVDSVGLTSVKPFGMALQTPADMPSYRATTRLRFNAKAESPAYDPDLPDEPDFSLIMKRRGIITTAFITPDSISSTSSEKGILRSIMRLREKVTDAIINSGFSDDTSSFLVTIVTGDTTHIDDDLRGQLNASGLAHILALSGLHIGIIAWFVSFLLWPIYAIGHRNFRMIAVVVILWIYALMTGLSPSVTRAVFMATVFTVGLISGRRKSPMNSLCLAALLILAFRPQSLFQPGFQMSVLAVASILILERHLNPFKAASSLRLKYLGQMVSVPLAAMIGTGVIAAFYFHTFPVYFLLSGAVSAILIPALLVSGLTAVAADSFGGLPEWMLHATDKMYRLLDTFSSLISNLPGSGIDTLYLSPLAVGCVLGAVAMFAVRVHTNRRVWSLLGVCWLVTAFTVNVIATPDYAESDVYCSRSSRATNILVKDGTKLMLITSAKGVAETNEVVHAINKRHIDFMRRRSIDSVSIAPRHFSTPSVSRNGNSLIIKGRQYFMLSNNLETVDENIPPECTIIVCSGFRGDIVALARDTRANAILLGNCLETRRHNRYYDELTRAGIPCASLKKSFRFD